MSSPQEHIDPKRRAMIGLTRFMFLNAPWVVSLATPTYRKMKKKPTTPRGPLTEDEILNLKAGEWVEVLSEEEIMATLDEEGRYRGLRFMPEMRRFCGQRFRVFKQVKNMLMECTGEMRQMKIPTVYLEGAYCDGEFHGGCDRSCFVLWREGWLKRVSPLEEEK